MPAATNLAYLFLISPSEQDKMLMYTGFIAAVERKQIKHNISTYINNINNIIRIQDMQNSTQRTNFRIVWTQYQPL